MRNGGEVTTSATESDLICGVAEAGWVSNCSIFYHATTRQLFAYVEIEDEARWLAMARTEICQDWWRHMKEIMPTNADLSPASANLAEVFHLD